MNKIILILITVLFTSNVLADHYKKKINIKEFSPKQHCSKKKSLLETAAIVGEAAECRMAGLFLEPELTTNTKMLYVHGSIDNLTLAKPCEEHVKKIRAKPGQIKIDIKEGWHHDWHAGYKPKKVKAMKMHKCPEIYVDNEGFVTGPMIDLVLNKYKIFPSMEAAMKASEDEPVKTFKKMFGIFKKEKCLERGVTIGGKHMDEYMPQFVNFFKENLL